MPIERKEEMEGILKKYRERLENTINAKKDSGTQGPVIKTREYTEFKKQYLPKTLSFYEKMCFQSEKLLHIKVDPKREKEFDDAIKTCHLEITPSGAMSFAVFTLICILLLGITSSFLFYTPPPSS